MGRVTRSHRARLQERMVDLKSTYRAALKDEAGQRAFDELFEAWAGEMAAMIYQGHPDVLKMLLLTAVVDNRRVLEELRREVALKRV